MKMMMPTFLGVAVFTGMAAADPAVVMMNRNECPGTEHDKQTVCLSTNKFDDGVCSKRKGGKEYKCFIPDCFKSGPAPDAVPACQPTDLVVSAASVDPTDTTDSFKPESLFSGMEGWPDIPKSKFLNFPTSLEGRLGQIPNVYVAKDWPIHFACTVGNEGDKCDLFAFIYRCPPCTFSNGGNFALKLLMDDWEPYSCGVNFQLDHTVPTHKHDVIVYHKQMDKHGVRDTGYKVSPDDLLELAWFAKSPATAHCSGYDEAECATELPDECKWDAETGVCKRVLCPPKSQGPDRDHPPGPGQQSHKPKGPWIQRCKVCVDDEREMYIPKLKVMGR